MRKLFIYALVGLSLVGCDSSRDSGGAAGTAAVEHERTLRYSKAEDGSTVIQAIRITNGQRAVDTAAGKDAVQSRGGFMNQVAFKECGRVNFASTGPGEGVVQGIHTGRGMTAKCKIRNWDGQWHIVESR
ncbi:hypothetical protein MOQ67_31170 (plasmid) [Pseudomonas sp. LY-1]|jgi:hypothetical protein|uniref:Lipoprotein n=1 Tax=Pseudomonas veronii TaxID=76761 RepID=A0A7Y1FA85_PSEVE|nr:MULTISPECIES: hypothetical protein [Pseudomonas]OHC25439.1 MAG: hypothetical protein A3J25_00005 [Pseudomonadales bacterium RIFCSPLOWO2_02_FULL_63_210]EKF8205661.1 hypothetical protein [Pseudomonas aeruginosa]EKI0126983.1 hypothetical protein [Pseudomonas aeruginosa]EMD6030781.1 hypothetical protein [Pseudomonas aeruginosa]MCF5507361.1 hypothetical protein [Pseudomonas sp. PA-3-6H]